MAGAGHAEHPIAVSTIGRAIAGICAIVAVGLLGGSRAASAADRPEPAIIMLMVDDLPPAEVDQAVRAGELPNIEEHFYRHGTRVPNFYTSLALSSASWSTILTGRDVDESCIKGNEVFHRDTFRFDNFLDWRRDMLRYIRDGRGNPLARMFGANNSGGRHQHGYAYTAIHGCQNLLLSDYLNNTTRVDDSGLAVDLPDNESTVYTSFFLLNNNWLPPGYDLKVLCDVIGCERVVKYGWREALTEWSFGPPDNFNLDHTVTRLAVDRIRRADEYAKKKIPIVKKKFFGLYYSIVDNYFHQSYRQGLEALKAIDHAVGEIFQALQSSAVYGDSIVVLVSDHGFVGGYQHGDDNPRNPFHGDDTRLMGVNLSTILGGYSVRTREKYRMNVEAAYAGEDKYSLKFWEELQLQKFQCTNLSRYQWELQRKEEPGNPLAATCMDWADRGSGKQGLISAGVASPSMIALPYASTNSGNWQTPNTWFTLTHYDVMDAVEQVNRQVNILADLLDYERDVDDMNRAVEHKVGPKPVDWLAVVIDRGDFNLPDSRTQGLRAKDDDVVVIYSRKGQALLFQELESGKWMYRYVPVQQFDQARNGAVSFELSEGGDDPLGYRAEGADAAWFAAAHSAKEWIARFSSAVFPNAVPALARIMSFHGKAAATKASVRFDIFLNPTYGYFFTSYDDVAGGPSQHGMLQRESMRASFFIAGPGIGEGNRIDVPMTAIDVVPTVLAAVQRVKENRRPGEKGLKYDAPRLPPAYLGYDKSMTQLPGDVIEEIFK
jgi:arylsulfatase A-like enzyme